MSADSKLLHADMRELAREVAVLRMNAALPALQGQRYEQALRLIAFKSETLECARETARIALHPKVRA